MQVCIRSLLHSFCTLNLQHFVRDRCARDRSSSRSISSSNTMADSARDAQSVDDRLINLEVNLATLYRLLNLDVVASAAFSSEKRRREDGALDAALDLPATWKRHCALTSKQEDNSEIPSNRMQRCSESLASTTQIENLASTTHIENLASKIVDIENTLQQIARCAGETMKTIYGPSVLDLVNRGELPRHRGCPTIKY